MRIAEMIREGKACILVQMIRTIMTTTPISIAMTGFIQNPPYLFFGVNSRMGNV